jgi:hypothetical protein
MEANASYTIFQIIHNGIFNSKITPQKHINPFQKV